MERRERVSWLWLAWLCAGCAGWVCVAQAEPCEREDKEGCSVTAGHAHCQASDFRVIERLPACTTNITYSWFLPKNSSQNPKICLGEAVNFTHLPHLEELTVRTDRDTYSEQWLVVHEPTCFTTLQQSLRVFRYRGRTDYGYVTDENAGMYAHFKKLDTLELTRADKLGLSNIMHLLGPKPSVKALMLKNVHGYGSLFYTPDMDLAYFVCGGDVEWLDLRYNDIVTINVTKTCWSTKLKYLNLDHNVLAQTVPHQYFLITVFPMLSGLQILRASPDGSVYQDGLWEDSEETDVIDYSHDPKLSSTELSALALLEKTPVGFLAGFDFWLKDVLKPCKGITYLQLVKCAAMNYHDKEAFYVCLDPNVNSYNCIVHGPYSKLICLLLRNCNYSCEKNIPLPLPTKLRVISMRNMLHFHHKKGLSKDALCKSNEIRFHPKNELQVLDMRNPSLYLTRNTTPSLWISGLQKLRYINLQGHHVPFLLSEMTISDLTALEELHIGGDRVSQQDIVRSHTIEGLPKLSLLNLSYSKIRGFDNDAFVTQKRLSVLDLSHNELTAPALASLDLSHTRLRSLNLSHNQLTSLPPSLRHQLQLMEGLEVYLSGNTFICSCDNLAFLEWIQSDMPITFHYAGDHVCTDSPGNTVHNIAVDSLYCNWYWQQPLIILAATLASCLLLAALVMAYRKRYHISNLVFRVQEAFRRDAEDAGSLASRFKFDAYVIYSDADEDRLWVHYVLAPTLEDFYGFRLCLEHRNFPGGYDRVDNITKAIATSRKVLLVMSDNWLRSDWCLRAGQMASNFDPSKFVVIMYKDVLFSGVHVPPVVEQALRATRAVTWAENPVEAQQLFWKMLRKCLYQKRQMADQEEEEHDRNILLNQF